MQVMLTKCVSPHVESIVSESGGSLKGKNSVLEKVFQLIESGLKYCYHAAWCQVLGIVQVAFKVMGRSCSDVIILQTLVSLCSLRETPNFPFIPQLEAAVGAAVETMGPRVVLEAIPLELENEDVQMVFPKAWLLPVLKKYVCNSELQFFTVTLLPLAARLRNKASMLTESGQNLEAKVYDTLQSQIWALLPSFCRNPVDLKQSFKNIARILGTALNERPELRKTVCHALCLLIDSSNNNDSYQRELSQFSKNFLPILFNLHTSEPASVNSSILGCIATYLSISDQQLINSLFGKVGVKLASTNTGKPTRLAIMDLALVMVPYVSQKSLAMLYKAVVTLLESDDRALQKKTYKILERICSCKSEHHQAFIESHLDALQSSLLTSLSSAAASSKKPRLKCLSHIVHRLKGDQTDFIYSVIPEVILCTKEVNEGTRTEAYSLLVDMANAHDRCCDGSHQDNISQYFQVVLAGLAATSPHMLSATILSIGRLVYEFKDVLSHDMIQKLLTCMKSFLVSRSREVVKATLGFIKVIVSVLDSSHLLSLVQELISSTVSWTKNTNYHFRHECRVLFERLVRKLGYEVILGMVPESHRKLLVHVHKAVQRAKKKKAKRKESETVKNGLSTKGYEELLGSSSDEDESSTNKKVGLYELFVEPHCCN
jgi:ribosomal RNA-processing protein 12